MIFRNEDKRWLGDAMGDVNEQEQEKCEHEPPMERPIERPSVDEPFGTPLPREDIPCQFPIECPPRALPEKGKERRLARREMGMLVDGTPTPLARKHRTSSRFGGYLVMSASLLAAFLLMIGAFCFLPSERVVKEDIPEVFEENEAQKVIFVDRGAEGTGGLSTPELYARCIDSVVSISVRNPKSSGVGSGFVFREDGYIATAYHVVAQMPQIEVIFSDGSRYEATLVGGDAMTDLALLKVDATGLSSVTLGRSGELLPGERVVAIGTPASLDYAGSVSSGEVSYSLRTVKIFGEDRALEKKMKLIQTNAPVNPGNSGCPLFDGYGRVVGMVTMKLGSSFSGMGFAIPTDGAIDILEAMLSGQALTEELLAPVSVRAATLGIEGEACERDGVYGVRITRLENASGTGQVLCVGDVILTLGEKAVTSFSDVEQALSAYEPHDTVKITVLRNGQRLQFEVVLHARGDSVEK